MTAYFDDTCNLCTASVRFAKRNDSAGAVHFEPLDSEMGRAISLGRSGSIVVTDGARTLVGSDAVLAIAAKLEFPYPALAAGAHLLPRPVREALYRWIAANRYRWFGRCV